MRVDSLPIEIVAHFLPLLPTESLISSSTVCKAWRSVALPILYESIRLVYVADDPSWAEFTCFPAMSIKNYLEEFTERVLNETDGASRIPSCARRLRIDMELKQEDADVFITAISKMKNLGHIDWTVSGMTEAYWYRTLERLCLELPNLRSLRLVMAHNKFLQESSVASSISQISFNQHGPLAGLETLFIEYDGHMGERPSWTMPNMIAKLIHNAHNIEFLEMDPKPLPTRVMGPIWGVDSILTEIPPHSLPRLSHLRVGAYEHPAFTHNFGQRSFGIWKFIQNHTHLQAIALEISEFNDREGAMIFPRDIEEAMPSIRQFGGPVSVVTALINSRLGAQLEILDIAYPDHLGRFYIQELSTRTLPELSCLRTLRIYTSYKGTYDSNGDSDVIYILGKIAPRAPILRELAMLTTGPNGPSQSDQEKLLDILAQLPYLRRLALAEKCLQRFNDVPPGTPSFSERAKAR